MLEKFRKAKMAEIAHLREYGVPQPFAGMRPDFKAALAKGGGINVIAEYKRASPSRGIIRSDLSVEAVAAQYAANGAAALSILTEESWFMGDLAFLEEARAATNGQIPILRKDFLFDPLQIAATAATPASALLLIARMLKSSAELRSLIEQSLALGMAPVVEIFDSDDLKMARDAGAEIIQVNARDLDTLQVSREACLELIGQARPQANEVWIAASGISKPEHLDEAANAGFQAALVGTALMQAENPGQELGKLLRGAPR